MKGLNFATASVAQPARTHEEILQAVAAIKAALPVPPKEKFLIMLSPEAAERLKAELPEALELENVRVDTLGIVTPGCYLKLPDTRSTSIFDLKLDLKP